MRSRIAIFAWYELSSFILRWHSRGQHSVATLAARSSFDIGFPCSHNKSSDMTIGKSIYRYIITVKPACLSNIVRKNGILGRLGLHHRQSWIPGSRLGASRGWRHDRPACLPHRSIPSTRRGRLEQRPITMHRTLFRVPDRVALSGMSRHDFVRKRSQAPPCDFWTMHPRVVCPLCRHSRTCPGPGPASGTVPDPAVIRASPPPALDGRRDEHTGRRHPERS